MGYQARVEDGARSMRREADRQEVYMRRPPSSWEKAGIVGVLAWLFRRPLAVVFLVVMLVLGLLMLLHPSWTALALLVIGGLFAVHYVHRSARR
jgi:Flp pilus assembly protein TadB